MRHSVAMLILVVFAVGTPPESLTFLASCHSSEPKVMQHCHQHKMAKADVQLRANETVTDCGMDHIGIQPNLQIPQDGSNLTIAQLVAMQTADHTPISTDAQLRAPPPNPSLVAQHISLLI